MGAPIWRWVHLETRVEVNISVKRAIQLEMIPYCLLLLPWSQQERALNQQRWLHSFQPHMMKEALLVRNEIIKASAIPARQAMKARLIQANW